MASKWIRGCIDNHAHPKNTDGLMPSRPLDLVNPSQSVDEKTINLIDTGGTEYSYVTLSHCWGQEGHFKLYHDNLREFKRGIKVSSLPKTYQDATTITKRLNVRYLWIDSLCIIQDDMEDWAMESGRMDSVYTNSVFTIAADHAKDGRSGCFNNRPSRKYVTIDGIKHNDTEKTVEAFLFLPGLYSMRGDKVELRGEALSARAWAFQERVLSIRALHFCSDQMYYECDNEFISEDSHQVEDRWGKTGSSSVPQ